MTDNERIELLRSYSQLSSYPPALTDAMCDYLTGQGSLKQVRQHALVGLKSIFSISPSLLSAWDFGRHDPAGQQGQLDELDERLLDVCLATHQVWDCLHPLTTSPALRPAVKYVLAQGMVPQTLLQGASVVFHHAFASSGELTPIGEALLALLPTEPHAFSTAALFATPTWPKHHYGMYAWLVRLLLSAHPPLLDHAHKVVEELAADEETPQVNSLGQCAVLLFGADPTRFTPLLRRLVGPDSRASSQSRMKIILALLRDDPSQHAALAVEVLRSTPAERYWNPERREALQLLFQFDRIKFLPVLGEAARALDSWEASQLLQLLAQAPFEASRQYLQHCVAEGSLAAASQALKMLLSQPWEGRQEYAVSRLSHHSRRIRREATAWLAQQGDAVLACIEPFLTHLDAEVRLSAIDALAAIGGERTLGILRARLDLERSAKVRQAIFGVVGVAADQRASGPLTRETLLANATATLHYVSKPAPRWFVATEVLAPRWANNEPVPPEVLLYLLCRQSLVTAPASLDGEVSQALALLNGSTTGSLASALLSGWVGQGYSAKEAWCIPLICALGDDVLLPALSLRVEDWYRDHRRKLAIRIIQALPLFESQAAINELRGLAKGLRRGVVKTAAKETLAVVAP